MTKDTQVQNVLQEIDASEDQMVQTLKQLISIPAVGPENGGEGETVKAEALLSLLREAGFDKIEQFDAADERVPSRKRPNITAYLNGETPKRLWIVTHLDVVPSGEESLWKVTKPFQPLVKDNRVYGRGSEDNGQSLVASLFAAKVLRKLGVVPTRTVGLAFVSDEEMGSVKGIQHLLDKGVFRLNDWVIVPDSGSKDGSFVEVAEKSILWFKLTTFGKQSHGSMPEKGLNAHRAGMRQALALDGLLQDKYNARNGFFDVPFSTFEPTRKDKNVDAVNIVPGEDTVYFDCRVLPEYSLDAVLSDIRGIIAEHEKRFGVSVTLEVLQRQDAPALDSSKSEVVGLLRTVVKRVRGVDVHVGGVGGGTCAAFFRRFGIPAVVWSSIDEVAHQPDEYCWVRNLVEDAKVFALLMAL